MSAERDGTGRLRSGRRGRERRASPPDRGQTTLDFAVGAGIFLIAVAFVVAFMPGMFAPFEGADPTQAADRFSATLAHDLLGGADDGRTVRDACAAGFFATVDDDEATEPAAVDGYRESDCRFDPDEENLRTALATDHAVNVTVEGPGPDDGVATVRTVTLAAGPSAADRRSITVSRRVILVDGTARRLIVRVW